MGAHPTGHAPDAPVAVRVHGLVRGGELPHAGALALDGAELTLALPTGGWFHRLAPDATLAGGPDGVRLERLRLPLAALDGIARRDGALALHLAGDDVIELAPEDAPAAPAFDALAARAVALAHALPEVTRALRAFGSRRGLPGSDHDRFFAPLVEPLRAARDVVAAGGDAPWAAAERFDPSAVDAGLRDALAALAAERAPDSPPDRRALEAELLELVEPLLDAVAALGAHADAVRAARDDRRLVAWRGWAGAVAAAFAEADRCWIAALPVLADARGGQGRFWRRVLRRDGVGRDGRGARPGGGA